MRQLQRLRKLQLLLFGNNQVDDVKRIYTKVGGFLVGRKDGDAPVKKVMDGHMNTKDYRRILDARDWGRLHEIQIETTLDVGSLFAAKK